MVKYKTQQKSKFEIANQQLSIVIGLHLEAM